MKKFFAAFITESMKLKRSGIFWITIVLFVFIPAMMALMVWVARNPEMASKLGLVGTKATLFGQNDWAGYFSLLLQGIATIGLIGFGFVTAWVFGREYMDKTMKDILALPVSRSAVVMAKFAVVFLWSALLTVILYLAGLAMGYLVHISGWSVQVFTGFTSAYFHVALLTILVSQPVAFFACYGRGIVAPIGFVIVTLIIAQFVSIVGLGPYFPWAIPGILTVNEHTRGFQLVNASYVILLLTMAAGMAGTVFWWRFADQH